MHATDDRAKTGPLLPAVPLLGIAGGGDRHRGNGTAVHLPMRTRPRHLTTPIFHQNAWAVLCDLGER
jgi:hypothetical protein